LNGDYVIVDGVTRNNRSVYRFTGPEVFGHKCIYLYFDTNGRWRVAAKDTFDGRSSTAYIMGVGFTGMTPVGDGEWQIYMNKKWTTLPEITTKPLNDAQALRTLMDEKERLKNNISVDDIKGLRLAGLTGKAKQECLNGVYNIVKDMKINDHPVFMFKEKAYVCVCICVRTQSARVSFLSLSLLLIHPHTPTHSHIGTITTIS